MTAHVLEAGGKPAFVVLPYEEYQALLELVEDSSDSEALSRFAERLAEGTEWTVPVEVADRLLRGESPIRVWRQVRGLSAGQLAAAVHVVPAYVHKLESGRGQPSVSLLRRLARALDVDAELLLPTTED